MVFRSAKVIVISLGRCCKHGGGVPRSPDCCSSCNMQGKMREGGVDDGKGMVSDVEGVWSLGGREMFSSMGGGRISVCLVVVVLMVAVGVVVLTVVVRAVGVGVVVLMVVVGVVVLMIVVGELYIGADPIPLTPPYLTPPTEFS